MKVTVATLTDEIFALDVSEDLEIENFKALCEVETAYPAKDIVLTHNGIPLLDYNKSLKQCGVQGGDVIVLLNLPMISSLDQSTSSRNLPPAIAGLDFSSVKVPQRASSSSATNIPVIENSGVIREMFLSNADQLAALKRNNPRLAEALLSGNVETFSSVLREQTAMRSERQQRSFTSDLEPLNAEAQKMIAEQIRRQNIDANMQAAIEYNPETFGTVVMLFINCHVNGFPVKAYIDSGAQTTIMSVACAERCNIMRLIDARWAGIAKGVGVQRIIGRIHMVQIKIENDFLTTSFSVLEKQPMDMLLGLDMLKRHQCNIDLKRNVLQIGTTGTETPFLPESELPPCAQLSDIDSNDELMKQSIKDHNEPQTTKSASNLGGESSFSVRPDNTENVGLSNPSLLILPTDPFGEAEVEEIVSLGFTREQAINELRRFNGDKTQATVALFAKSLKF